MTRRLLFLFIFAALPAFAIDYPQPPFEVIDPAISENFRESFYGIDDLNKNTVKYKDTSRDLNVKDFGALGDGSTDDAVVIQGVMDLAESMGGATVFFPPGTYIIGTGLVIASSTTLRGINYGAVTLKAKDALNDRIIENAGADPDSNIVLENLIFDLNGANQTGSTAPTFNGVAMHQVIRCAFINPYDSLYLLTGHPLTDHNEDVYYYDVLFDGRNQQIATDVVDIGSGRDIRMSKIRAIGAKAGTGQTMLSIAIVDNFVMENSWLDGDDNGSTLSLYGIRGGKLDGTEIFDSFEWGVRVQKWTELSPSKDMDGFSITNCNIHDNGFDGVAVYNSGTSTEAATNVVIANNQIWNNQRSGIYSSVAKNLNIYANGIYNNSLASTHTYSAIRLDGGGFGAISIFNVKVHQNYIYDTSATPSQTQLFYINYSSNVIIEQNVTSQAIIVTTTTNSTNVYFRDYDAKVMRIEGGGTNSGVALNNNRAMQSLAGAIVESVVTSTELGYLSGSTATIQTQLNTKGDMFYANTRYYVGTASRNEADASGTAAITGLGFAPKAVIFFSVVDGTIRVSWGFSAASGHRAISRYGTNYSYWTSNSIISHPGSGSDYTTGEVSAFGADGFTINYTKNGSPTGTMTIFYLALR